MDTTRWCNKNNPDFEIHSNLLKICNFQFIKLQRLKQKKKQLAARVSSNNNNKRPELDENDKCKLLEAKIAQKRKNPFAK